MTQALNGATVAMNYAYNGLGEQVRKYLGTTNTYSLYDDAGRWIGDYGNAGVPSQQVIWFDDLPVGVLVGTGASQKLHYIEPDALGTPRVVIDRTRGAEGTAIWTWGLQGEAFGTTAPNQDPDGDATAFVFDMRFPGQRYDAASGLNYNYFRDYEPAVGRYTQSDPIGLGGGVSTYGYVGGNPAVGIDPMGLAGMPGQQIGLGSSNRATQGMSSKLDSCECKSMSAIESRLLNERLGSYIEIDQIASVVDTSLEKARALDTVLGDAGKWAQRSGDRYIYTDYGWIDLKHLIAAASLPFGAELGDLYEFKQKLSGSYSAGMSEDLRSNDAGAFALGMSLSLRGRYTIGQSAQLIVSGYRPYTEEQARALLTPRCP